MSLVVGSRKRCDGGGGVFPQKRVWADFAFLRGLIWELDPNKQIGEQI
jgi:hypothetical protein